MFIEIRSEIIRRISDSTAELLCDVHHYLTYGDTRTVAFSLRSRCEHLLPYQDELDENRGVIIEHLMAQCIHRTLLAGGRWGPFLARRVATASPVVGTLRNATRLSAA